MLFSSAVSDLFERSFESDASPFGFAWLDSRVADARAQLNEFTRDERKLLQSLVLWLLDGAPDFEKDEPQIDFPAIAPHAGPSRKLHHCHEQLGDPPAIDNALRPKWEDLYAALALDLLLRTYVAGDFGPGMQAENEEGSIAASASYNDAIEYASQACEALAYARLEDVSAVRLDKHRSIVATEGGLARHAKTRPLKDDVRKRYETRYGRLSNRQAAKKITRELTNEGVIKPKGQDSYSFVFNGEEVLLNTDPEKQVEKWIAEFKNNR